MNFQDKLDAARKRNHSNLCIGLGPENSFAIIEATADLVCAYKPQSAFFEAQGIEGWRSLQATIAAVPNDIPVILDAKRGDVAHTAEAYATACFDVLGADAVTVNPYLGGDAVRPFLTRPDKTAFVLCHTSNPSALDFQHALIDNTPLYLKIATSVQHWSAKHNNAGLVVGATYPQALANIRTLCPNLPILVPGIGPQGAVTAWGNNLLIVAERAINTAPDPRKAAEQLRETFCTQETR